MYLEVGFTVDHLKHTSMVIQRLDVSEQKPLGKIIVESSFDKIEDFEEYLIINVDASCNVLLVRPWMHKYDAIPLTYH